MRHLAAFVIQRPGQHGAVRAGAQVDAVMRRKHLRGLRRGVCIDDTALDPPTMKLRRQEQPGRACTHHENSHISNHVEPVRCWQLREEAREHHQFGRAATRNWDWGPA